MSSSCFFSGHLAAEPGTCEGREGIAHVQMEDILGVIDWDGRSIIWVDHEDETVHRARLINETTMEVIAFEPGPHAVVNRMIMILQ